LARSCGVRSWRFTRRDEDGRAFLSRKIIETPDPINLDRLFIVAHECGHIALQHGARRPERHRGEFEAEQFAMLLLRHFNVPVPYGMVQDGQHYVAWQIEQDLRHGRTELDRDSVEWGERHLSDYTHDALASLRAVISPFHDTPRYQRLLDEFLMTFEEAGLSADGSVSYRRTSRQHGRSI
jgi:hypothetical protein